MSTKKLLIWGFIFGAVILPVIYIFGLIVPGLEYLRYVLPGFDMVEPMARQIGADTYETTPLMWILSGLINGGMWMVIFYVVGWLKRKRISV